MSIISNMKQPCKWVSFVAAALFPVTGFAAEVTLGLLDREYTGSPIVPSVATVPEVSPVTLLYRKISPEAPAPVSEIAFNNNPPVPQLSFASINFSGQGVIGLGNYVRLGNNSRKLESCEVQLVTWAKAADYPVHAENNPDGYTHPVTLSLYSVNPDLQFTLLTDLTRNIFIPWRPLTLPDGSPYPYNGYAVTARFEFADGIILPEQVMVTVDYNTSTSGNSPTGIPGPADVLNLAVDGNFPSVGADLDADVILRMTPEAWYYPNTGFRDFNGPITKLTASNTVTKIPPVEPGTYEVTAIAGATGTEGKATGILTISPITQIDTGLTFEGWQQQKFTQSQLDADMAVWDADPDGDTINNLIEYATGQDPNVSNGALEVGAGPGKGTITLVHPSNISGIKYLAEESTDLLSWSPVPVTVLSTDLPLRTIQAKASSDVSPTGQTYLRFRFELQ